jgi:predicted DNA-binding ribbon-helix-helix protein
MNELKAVPDEKDPWDSGELGRDAKYVACAPEELKKEIESALELQMISIRLQKELISELKLIADYRGISYQPLIRDVLSRFARAEIRQIASELREQQKAREEIECAEKEKKRA